jgi:hypothetical protein
MPKRPARIYGRSFSFYLILGAGGVVQSATAWLTFIHA